MTDPLFLADFDRVAVGDVLTLTGEEAHHAVAVKRIVVGEGVLLCNGRGLAARAVVNATGRRELSAEVIETIESAPVPITWQVAQALAKGDRSDIAVQGATEVGARGIIAWQASRSIVRWQGERGDKALEKWRATAREASKQSRRLWVPEVRFATTGDVVEAVREADVALILHEDAALHIASVSLPVEGTGLLIVGPEGGIAPDELERFLEAGALAVSISDGVLRTSTAGAVALGQLDVLVRRP